MHPEPIQQPNPGIREERRKLPLWKLGWYFFWIALTTVQGAQLHMRRQVVDRLKLVDNEEFFDSFGLAEIVPQPDSTFGLGMHLGYRIRGVAGTIVVSIAMLLPSLILVSLLGLVFARYSSVTWVQSMADGAASGVCAILLVTLIEISRKSISEFLDVLIVAACLILLRYGILHISGVLLWITPLALWLHAPSRHEKLPNISVVPGFVPTLGFRHYLRKYLGNLFHHPRWGSIVTALAIIMMFSTVFGAEYYHCPPFEKLKELSPAHLAQESAKACPAVSLDKVVEAREKRTGMEAPILEICTQLVGAFTPLSICAVGGEETILPCLQHISVDHNQWINDKEFVNIFAMSFLIPGPSMLLPLIGLRALYPFGEQAAIEGVMLATLAVYLPNLILILAAARSWEFIQNWRWTPSIGRAMILIATGALMAGLMYVSQTTLNSPVSMTLAVVSFLILLVTDLNPVLVVLLSGVAGVVLIQ